MRLSHLVTITLCFRHILKMASALNQTSMGSEELTWSDRINSISLACFSIALIFLAVLVSIAVVIMNYLLSKREDSKSVLDTFSIYRIVATCLLATHGTIINTLTTFSETLGVVVDSLLRSVFSMLFYQLFLSVFAMIIVQFSLVFQNSRVAKFIDKFSEAKLPIYFYIIYWITGLLVATVVGCISYFGSQSQMLVVTICVASLFLACIIGSVVAYIILRRRINAPRINPDQEEHHEESHILNSNTMMVGLGIIGISMSIRTIGWVVITTTANSKMTAGRFAEINLALFNLLQAAFYVGILMTSPKLLAHLSRRWYQLNAGGTIQMAPPTVANQPTSTLNSPSRPEIY